MRSIAPSGNNSKSHILVVDDEPEIADSLAEYLVSKEAYRVTVASNGQEATDFLQATHSDPQRAVDLVLLDMRMPIMTGPEVLIWLRNHPNLKYTRVIVLTAAASNRDKVEALSSGADDYITKPYYPQELLARVKTILRTQQLEKELQDQSQQLADLNRISLAVSAELKTSDVLDRTVKGVNQIFNVDLSAVYLADNGNQQLLCRSAFSPHGNLPISAFAPISSGKGVIAQVYRDRSGLCLNNPADDERFAPGVDAPPGLSVVSIMAMPLNVRGKPVGVVTAVNKQMGAFSDIDQGLFASLASSVSQAIENALLFQSVRNRQQELLESRNTLQALIDGILHPIYTIDRNWNLVAVNDTKAAEMDAEPISLVGHTCYRVFYNRDAPCEHCKVQKTLTDKHAGGWSLSWQGDDHLHHEWDISAFPMPGSKAESPKAVIVWQNRTEERRLENSLMQAGKLAAIGKLAAGVAHEINNPLTVINANAQMLQMVTPKEEDNYEAVDLIVRAGDRAATVVQGLLDFARQAQYEFESGDVNDSIHAALNLVSYQFANSNIEVVTNLADDLPPTSASWEHLQSVWLNLLINARDALQDSQSERMIEITTTIDQARDNIVVIIGDNGEGMNPAELDQIFEPFYTTKAPGRGTGLGLATTHRIIEQHGGQIEVTSAVDDGTTFVIRLPLAPDQELLEPNL
ncbi:MAG TPA: response regulator [candidate division Zixibacteria bacterium]|nr:response regulator [candidate division Zixibacteria bacterium]